jgi:hypothetical protein
LGLIADLSEGDNTGRDEEGFQTKTPGAGEKSQ